MFFYRKSYYNEKENALGNDSSGDDSMSWCNDIPKYVEDDLVYEPFPVESEDKQKFPTNSLLVSEKVNEVVHEIIGELFVSGNYFMTNEDVAYPDDGEAYNQYLRDPHDKDKFLKDLPKSLILVKDPCTSEGPSRDVTSKRKGPKQRKKMWNKVSLRYPQPNNDNSHPHDTLNNDIEYPLKGFFWAHNIVSSFA